MKRNNRRPLWIAIATTIVTVALAGGAYAAPQSSTTKADKHTIQLTEASAHPRLTVVDVGAPGPSPGDQVVTTDGVLDRNGAAAGTMSQVCTMVTPAASLFTSTFDCTGSFLLAAGTITVQGPFVPSADTNVNAVTGGTAKFVKAHGQVTIDAEADTITIELA